jgi:type II restriction enzyme
MRLGFHEPDAPYDSGSQRARFWTERWFAEEGFCPHCGNANVKQFRANKPVADFFCTRCNEVYELKSQKSKIGRKVVDGAYDTMCARLEESDNPNFCLMRYNPVELAVTDLMFVPKHFFVRDVIEERRSLAPTARRAGWRGCNILLDSVEAVGRQEFELEHIYAFERQLSAMYPNNQNVRPKIRQQLQVLRDHGYLEFVGRGSYRLRDDV